MKSYDELLEENRLLRQQLENCQNSSGETGEDVRPSHLTEGSRYADRMSGGYLSYIVNTLHDTSFYRLYRRLYRVFRPGIVIVRILRYLMIFFTMLQASVVLFFAVAVSLVCLPFFLLALAFFNVRYLVERRKMRRDLLRAIAGKRVLIFFEEQGKERPFFDANMRAISKEYTVLAVHTGGGYFGGVMKDANGKKKRFLAAVCICDTYYRIRPRYYFYLKKHCLDKAAMTGVIY